MVAKLTMGVRKFEDVDATMRTLVPPLHQAATSLIPMIDADTDAFNDYVDALRLPEDTMEEKEQKQERMQQGLKKAINIPLTTMKLADAAWDAMIEVARLGNIASRSDVEVGAKALETGIWGAYRNVMINMTDITDKPFKKETIQQAEDLKIRAEIQCSEVLKIIGSRKE